MAGVLASDDIRFGTYDSAGEFNGFDKVYMVLSTWCWPNNGVSHGSLDGGC